MIGSKVKFVFDLGAPGRKSAEPLRQQLLAGLKGDEIKTYGSNFMGLSLRHLGGMLVELSLNEYGNRSESWAVFDGLRTLSVQVSMTGTDHFPEAGLYHYSAFPQDRDLRGVTAEVHWDIDVKYPVGTDFLESQIRETFRQDSWRDVRIEVPVVRSRTWKLTLVAPSLKRALYAYGVLRSGQWPLRHRFTDAVADPDKVRQVAVRFESEVTEG